MLVLQPSPRPVALVALALSIVLPACDTNNPVAPEDPPPTISITEPEECACIQPGDSITFETQTTDADTIEWRGASEVDGQTGGTLGPITFPTKGIFEIAAEASNLDSSEFAEVKIIVRDDCGPFEVTIDDPGDAERFDVGTTVPFASTVTGGDPPLTFEWVFDANAVQATTEDPAHTFLTPGVFPVQVFVMDAVGDVATAGIQVEIVQVPELEVGVRSLPVSGPDGFAVIRSGDWAGLTDDFILTIGHGDGVHVFDPVDEASLDPEFDAEGVARVGTVPLLAQGADGPVSALLRYGSSSVITHHRDGDWDVFSQLIDSFVFVTDALAFGNQLEADGFAVISASRANFYAFDEGTEAYQFDQEIPRGTIDPGTFANLIGIYPDASGESFLAVFDGSPGALFVHDRSTDPGVEVGAVGNSPRKVRCLNGVFVVTNFGSDDLTIGTFDGTTAAIVTTAPVGEGPIDVDLLARPGGQVAAVTTGFDDDTMTVLLIDPDGTVVSSTTVPLPADCSQSAHAQWARDADDRILLTGFGSDTLHVVESGL